MSPEQAAKLLTGKKTVFIVTEDLPDVISAMPPDVTYHLLARDMKHPYGVISNRSGLKVADNMAVAGGEWELHTQVVTVRRMRGTTAWIEPYAKGRLTLDNLSTHPYTLRLLLFNGKIHRIYAGTNASVTLDL